MLGGRYGPLRLMAALDQLEREYAAGRWYPAFQR
jgi:hypothetical protein